MQISAPFAGFLSVGLFGRHERKFSRHLKGLFLQAYRRFESPLLRHALSVQPGHIGNRSYLTQLAQNRGSGSDKSMP